MEGWFIHVIGIIGFASAVVIVLLVTLRSVLDIGHYYGFLPQGIEQSFISQQQRLIDRTLERAGLLSEREALREFRQFVTFDHSSLDTNYKEATKAIVRQTLKEGLFDIGRGVRVKSPYFIDLRGRLVNLSAATTVAKILQPFLKQVILNRYQEANTTPVVVDIIAGHRDGSPLLAAAFANLLGKPCVLYGERPYGFDENRGVTMTLEGEIKKGQHAILVDDSTTDGQMLLGLAKALREAGAKVSHAFVIFYRNEGKAHESLRSNDIFLHSILSLNTKSLTELKSSQSTLHVDIDAQGI